MVSVDIYFFDLIGCFAFAFYGSMKGLERGFGLVGLALCGFLAALGGGMIRELMLNHSPAFLQDNSYIVMVITGCMTAMVVRHAGGRQRHVWRLADAVGVSAFAYIGAARADQVGLGLAAMVLCAVLTAWGGGVLVDVVTRQTPALCYRSFYVAPAVLMAGLYWWWRPAEASTTSYGLLAVVLLLQLLITYRRWLRRQVGRLLDGRWRLPFRLSV